MAVSNPNGPCAHLQHMSEYGMNLKYSVHGDERIRQGELIRTMLAPSVNLVQLGKTACTRGACSALVPLLQHCFGETAFQLQRIQHFLMTQPAWLRPLELETHQNGVLI